MPPAEMHTKTRFCSTEITRKAGVIMLGEQLALLRHARGLRQKEVASHLGISREAYSQYENNVRHPSPPMLIQIADYFHVSMDFLAGRTCYEEQTPEILPDEARLIGHYRYVDTRAQVMLRTFASYEARNWEKKS